MPLAAVVGDHEEVEAARQQSLAASRGARKEPERAGCHAR
jgi:hypothetical protein